MHIVLFFVECCSLFSHVTWSAAASRSGVLNYFRTNTIETVLNTKIIAVQLLRICMFISVELSKGLTALTLNGHWALTNCEKWSQCNVTPLVSRISAVSMHLSSGLRVILLCIALWIQYVTFTYSTLDRPSLAFVSVFLNVLVLSPSLSFISLSLPSLKCLKVHCHCHHGNCHFCDAETCSCLLFRHHCWLTESMCVCVEGLCVPFSVCISLCISNQCFSHVYISLLCCCLQSIPWRSLVSVINKLSRTARLRKLRHTFIIRPCRSNVPEQCDGIGSLYMQCQRVTVHHTDELFCAVGRWEWGEIFSDI